MTSLNTYFDVLKPIGLTIKKNTTKLTNAIDDRLKITEKILQEQLDKALKPAESDASLHLWRPSSEHPSGEIIIIPTPNPISIPITSSVPEKSETDEIIPELKTVRRKKPRHSKNDFQEKQQIKHCLNDLINEIIEKENIEQCLNQLIDVIIVMNDLTEQTLFNTMNMINTYEEENPELSQIQSMESFISFNLIDTFIEEFDPCESSFNVNLFEEHLNIDTCESVTQQADTSDNQLDITITVTSISEPSTPSIIDTKKDSFINLLSTTTNMINPDIAEITHSEIKQEKRFSVVNHCSIPSKTIISHMSCSSTYIYICTNQRILFYTKIPTLQLNLSFQWYRYSEPAEQLIVSSSNQTAWRIFNKNIYSSNNSIQHPPIEIQWKKMKFAIEQSFLSIAINDQCGWYIKHNGTLWVIRINDQYQQSLNVNCPFHLNNVVCSIDKIGVTTNDGQILIRIGCTYDCVEGNGWIFIQHNFGPFDDFTLLKNNTICIIDKNHRLWIHQWTHNGRFYEILYNDNYLYKSNRKYLINSNEELLCITDCQQQINIFSDSLTGIRWSLKQKNTQLQRLIGAFVNENYVWALTTTGMICSSNGYILDKPRQAQYLTHATFVPDTTSEGTILWALDESCNIYVRNNVNENSSWEQLDQSQFNWNRRLIHIVCSSIGVWAVDDIGYIHFRHGHISNLYEYLLLNPAWIFIPGQPKYGRSFAQIFCGPEDWMVYATDNKQTVYVRLGINEANRVGTSWKAIEDCSALELAISEHTLWLLTSHGRIQCRENISILNPMGTRSTILPGYFHSITVSMDDSQVWALNSQRHLLKLDRLSILFEN